MTALFVTATGTDVGKTFVTAGLASHLIAQGRAVDAVKPVVSGFVPTATASSDPGVLLTALGRPVTEAEIANISPWRFRAPLAPTSAAQREGRTLDFAGLVEFCQKAARGRRDVLLIEGVGGIMVPLDDRHTVLDWMTALKLPVLLVAGSYLGTLSHTLSAVDVLQRRDLTIAAVVVSESVASPVSLDEAVATIARFVAPIPVLGIPRLPSGMNTHAAFGQLAELVS
jgi:dethiobiotin synthetase